jgi:tetratricopeptide (TPR) repeat protein
LVHRDTNRLDQSLESFQRSLRLRDDLIREYPTVHQYVADHASSGTNIGVVLRMKGDAAGAVTWLDQAVRALDQLLEREPRHATARRQLGQTIWSRALTRTELGRYQDAMADYDRALGLPGAHKEQYQMERAACQALSGAHAEAVAQIPDLLKASGAQFMVYRAARVRAAASQAVAKSDLALAQRYADEALEHLRELQRGGFFENAQNVKEALRDKMFDSLREHKDFRTIIGVER